MPNQTSSRHAPLHRMIQFLFKSIRSLFRRQQLMILNRYQRFATVPRLNGGGFKAALAGRRGLESR